MKALSIRQPWAWAILHAGKRIENREWKHPPSYRGPLLIHASKHRGLSYFNESAVVVRFACGQYPPSAEKLHVGGIVGIADLVDVVRAGQGGHHLPPYGQKGLECPVCGLHVLNWNAEPCPKASPWAMAGTYGLILDNVRPVDFVPCKGALGLFECEWKP